MKAALLLLAVACCGAQSLPMGSRPITSGGGGYTYHRLLTTVAAQAGSADSPNFALYIPITAGAFGTTLKTTANGGHIQHTVTQSGGVPITIPADLVVATDSTCTVPARIPFQWNAYSATGGIGGLFAQISNLSHTSDGLYYACYGDASVTTQQNTGALAPENVWTSDYVCVQHTPDGTTLSVLDSTSYGGCNGTNGGATATAGQIGGAAAFNGSSQSINLTHPSQFNFGAGDYTFAAWINPSSMATDTFILGKDQVGAGSRQFVFALASGGGLEMDLMPDDSHYVIGISSGGAVSTGAWYYVNGIRSGNAFLIYVNGTSQSVGNFGNVNFPQTMQATTVDAKIGQRTSPGNEGWFNGKIGEVRILNTAMSASRVTADYNNQKPSQSLVTIGPEF